MREKDKTLNKWGDEINQYKKQVEGLEQQIEDAKPKAKVPDPFSETYQVEQDERTKKISSEAIFEANDISATNESELKGLANLINEHFGEEIKAIEGEVKQVEAFTERINRVHDRIVKAERMETREVGGKTKTFYMRGAVEDAFHAEFSRELIANAEKRGTNKMGDALDKSNKAPISTPAGGGEGAPTNTDERLAQDYEGILGKAFGEFGDEMIKKARNALGQ